jgi:hypothetical protein
MGEKRRNRAEPPNPWVRAFVILIALAAGVYGVYCLIVGRLVTEGMVLERTPARLLGAAVAAVSAITVVRTFYPRRTEHEQP